MWVESACMSGFLIHHKLTIGLSWCEALALADSLRPMPQRGAICSILRVGTGETVWMWVLLLLGILLVLTAGLLFVRVLTSPLRPTVAFWWHVTWFYCKVWFRFRREGPCTVPSDGPVIIVANHTSSIDPLLLITATPHRVPAFLIAKEYSAVPVFGGLIRMLECIPVRRDGTDVAGTKAALRHLKAGKALGIFIEGRIARPGEVLSPKDGAALLALRTRAVVVPAHISGTVYDNHVGRSFFRRHRARVRFGEPLDLSAWQSPQTDPSSLAEVSTLLLNRIRELGRAGDAPQGIERGS